MNNDRYKEFLENFNADLVLEAYEKNPETNGVCFRSYRGIAEKFSLTKRQITDAAKFLDDLGLMKRSRL